MFNISSKKNSAPEDNNQTSKELQEEKIDLHDEADLDGTLIMPIDLDDDLFKDLPPIKNDKTSEE
jgi:hypothetical protein